MLLERQTQLEHLDGLLAEATRGHGHVAALVGEAGAGKSALVEAFIGAASHGTRIFRSACEDLSIPDPLGPLYDLAREAQWAMPQAIDARQGQRLPVFSDALHVFETRTQPTLLVIEDLHWADDATLDFVRFLGRRIANTHILLLLTARTDRSEGQMRVRRALGEIPAGSVARIDVPLLSEAAVLSLAAAAGRDGDAIYRASAGNAFFVTELLSAENEMALPVSVREAVLTRAERLSAGARAMLDAVSVFPRRADAWALTGLCGVASAGQLAECVSNGLLDDLGDAYAFRHEIARRAIEAMLTTSHRRAFNQRALSALLEKGDVATARLVHHAVEAHNFEAVRDFAPVAAREASRWASVRGFQCNHALSGCIAGPADIQNYVTSIVPPGIDSSPQSLAVTSKWLPPPGNPASCFGPPNNPGCAVQVQVTYNFKFILPFLPKSTYSMRSTSEMIISQ